MRFKLLESGRQKWLSVRFMKKRHKICARSSFQPKNLRFQASAKFSRCGIYALQFRQRNTIYGEQTTIETNKISISHGHQRIQCIFECTIASRTLHSAYGKYTPKHIYFVLCFGFYSFILLNLQNSQRIKWCTVHWTMHANDQHEKLTSIIKYTRENWQYFENCIPVNRNTKGPFLFSVFLFFPFLSFFFTSAAFFAHSLKIPIRSNQR